MFGLLLLKPEAVEADAIGVHRPASPTWGRVAAACWPRRSAPWHWSCPFRCPAPLAHLVIGPALAAAGEVLAVGDQATVQLAGEEHGMRQTSPTATHFDA